LKQLGGELTQRWLPRFGTLVAFGLVDIVGHGDELGNAKVVGELLAAGRRPG
jgi:hypothetical protein